MSRPSDFVKNRAVRIYWPQANITTFKILKLEDLIVSSVFPISREALKPGIPQKFGTGGEDAALVRLRRDDSPRLTLLGHWAAHDPPLYGSVATPPKLLPGRG